MMRPIGLFGAALLTVTLAACDTTRDTQGTSGSSALSSDAEALVDDAVFSAALSREVGMEEGSVESIELASALSATELGAAAEEDVEASVEEMDGGHTFECSLESLRERVVETYDADENGTLDEGEVSELREQFRPRPFRRHRFALHHRLARLVFIYDSDDSGDLDEDERAEVRADLRARCENRKQALIDEFDTDEDEELSDEEWDAAREELRARAHALRERIFESIDTDDDGRLEFGELLAAFRDRVERLIERRQSIFEEFDADGSDDLDDEERAALREWLKTFVRGEHFGPDEEEGGEGEMEEGTAGA